MVGLSARFYAPLFVSMHDLRFVDGIKLCLRIIGAVCVRVCFCASACAAILPVRSSGILLHTPSPRLRPQMRPHRPDQPEDNQQLDESRARREDQDQPATQRKSCSAISFKRSLGASAEGTNVRRSETSLMCRQPGAPSVIGARVCGCACDNRSKLCVWQREVERVGVERERANQLIFSL